MKKTTKEWVDEKKAYDSKDISISFNTPDGETIFPSAGLPDGDFLTVASAESFTSEDLVGGTHDIFKKLAVLKKDKRLKDANLLIIRHMDRKDYLKYGIFAAELTLPIFEKKHPNDAGARKAIEANKACLENDTKENREKARQAHDVLHSTSAAYADDDAYNQALLKIINYGISLLKQRGKS